MVHTFRSREGEEIMPIAHQYVFRSGGVAAPESWNGVSFGLGGRIARVPVHDLFGSSEGFRRPGYAVSVEPTIAVQRNRQRSVPDIRNGHHGDAAFAGSLVLLGYWRRF